MASGENAANATRTQLKLNFTPTRINLSSANVPQDTGELQNLIEELQKERARLFGQLEAEDKERHSYYTQLESIARQIRELPLPTDSPSLEYELERRRLELEAQRQQDLMQRTLGSAAEVVRRREERILALRSIDQKLSQLKATLEEREKAHDEPGKNPEPRDGLPADWNSVKELWQSSSSLTFQMEEKPMDTASVISFTSSVQSVNVASGSSFSGGLNPGPGKGKAHLGPKVEVVYNLLTMLFSHDRHNVSQKLLQLSADPETRSALHQAGCIPFLIQLIHSRESSDAELEDHGSWNLTLEDRTSRSAAAQALRNLVTLADDRRGRRETRVLRLLEVIREYSDYLRDALEQRAQQPQQENEAALPDDDMDKHPCAIVAALLKNTIDEEHRLTLTQLGALQAFAELLYLDQVAHGALCIEAQCLTVRRYVSMALTNLTFGDSSNKSLLCAIPGLLNLLSRQLMTPSDDLRQMTASVLRNLSWKADSSSKEAMKKSGVVKALMQVAMFAEKEVALKTVLSALWNLSAHSSQNKADICSTPGALEFLVRTLSYQSDSNTFAVVESALGILRNISSHIVSKDEYREILRRHNCLAILLQQLRSPSLTVVSNACGALWNLSARSSEDQATLCSLGAIPLLRSLTHSRHKMIAMGSSAALKNLITSMYQNNPSNAASPLAQVSHSSNTCTPLHARKQKALEAELDLSLTETCDNIEPNSPNDTSSQPPNPFDRVNSRMYRSLGGHNGSVYSRSSTSVMLTRSSIQRNQVRSTSLERSYTHQSPSVAPKVHRASPAPGNGCLESTRTAWRSQEDEISFNEPNYEEDDQPVDYSLKYTEEMRWASPRPGAGEAAVTGEITATAAITEKVDSTTVKKTMVYSAYRETDLDDPEHPTDFSLRYAEDDDGYTAPSDTTKTYCVEGTPHETPFSVSNAVSLTDLRETGLEKDDKEPEETTRKKENEEEREEVKKSTTQSAVLESEDKAETHCESRTPPPARRVNHKEGKTVTFNTEENYAEQTPLMFSRCSSLGSLDSIDQQVLADDGSIVSEFSRLTSRAVSPSELPDSPGQTMPPSPRRNAPPPKAATPPPAPQPRSQVFEDSTNAFKQEGTPAYTRTASPLSQLSFDDTEDTAVPVQTSPPLPAGSSDIPQQAALLPKPAVVKSVISRVTKSASLTLCRDVFIDEVKTFGEEDSPALTRCTSLSSLHIDGEVIRLASVTKKVQQVPAAALDETPATPQTKESETAAEQWSEESASDDELLEACINSGMPLRHSTNGGVPTSAGMSKGLKTSVSSIPIAVKRSPVGIPKSASANALLRTDSAAAATTQSDSESSEDGDEILYECIKSAMPKAKETNYSKVVTVSSSSSRSWNPNVGKPTPVAPNLQLRPRFTRPPMELPKQNNHQYQNRPSLPQGNVRMVAYSRAKSGEIQRSSGRRSRHSSQGSSRLGASGSSNGGGLEYDSRLNFKVEDTPVTFSRNSSLSSLSLDSNDEPSADEQALLDSVINSAMPKSRSDFFINRSARKKPSPSKLPTSHSWNGLRREGDGQASTPPPPPSLPTPTLPPPSFVTEPAVEELPAPPPEAAQLVEETLTVSVMTTEMTQSTMICVEANKVATEISQSEDSTAVCLEQVPSLTNSFIVSGDNLLENMNRRSPVTSRKVDAKLNGAARKASVNGNSLLRQALSTNMISSSDSLSLSSSCHSNIDNIKPPSGIESISEMSSSRMESSSLKCSVLGESYFDDDQKKLELLQELEAMERAVDVNANSQELFTEQAAPVEHKNSNRKRQTPKERRKMDKERYQTYTLNANNSLDDTGEIAESPVSDNGSQFIEKSETEAVEKEEAETSPVDVSITAADLELDAGEVIRTLKETRLHSSSEFLLDCETLSLVSDDAECEPATPGLSKPRIVKPEEKAEEPNPKAIRGRRRVLYTITRTAQPQQQLTLQQQAKKNLVAAVAAARVTERRGRSASPASPSPVRPNRTSALRQNTSQKSKYPSAPVLEVSTANGNTRLRTNSKSPRINSAPCSPRQLAQDDSSNAKTQQAAESSSKISANPVAGGTGGDPVPPPTLSSMGKQGTFTKEKNDTPSATQAAATAANKVPPKVPPKPKLMPKTAEAAAKPAVPKKPTRFNTSSPMTSPRTLASKSSPALSRRSVSSASIGSDSTTVTSEDQSQQQAAKKAPPKKIITSKIASLWKQVEESRTKQKAPVPDARKWISRGEIAKPVTEDKAVSTVSSPSVSSESVPLNQGLVSSSTFEKLSSFNSQLPVVSPSSRGGRVLGTVTSPTSSPEAREEKRKAPVRVTAL